MPDTNGNVVSALIKEAVDKNPGLTQTAIAERTLDLPPPYGEISPKVLYTAKSGGSIEQRSLASIAAIFSQLLEREIAPSELEAPTEEPADSIPKAAAPNNQTVIVRGDESDGITAAPGSTVNITRQIYKPD